MEHHLIRFGVVTQVVLSNGQRWLTLSILKTKKNRQFM
jgi:hypothetical protein